MADDEQDERRIGREKGGRVDGTNAQPGYHINLAAYKFAQDRVKPLQAAGRCKGAGGDGRGEPSVSHPWTLLYCRLLPSRLRDGVLRSSANCRGA